ncbi:MAG: aa3-type cytochrome c oxidase subunit IV [Candidatus Pelagibacterales bacterium]
MNTDQHKNTYSLFQKMVFRSSILIILVLILMAIFLL